MQGATKSPGSVTQETFMGYYDWFPLTAISVSAKADARHTSSDTFNTNYATKVLRLRNFGFSIPSNAVVAYLIVNYTARSSRGTIRTSKIATVGPGAGAAARIAVAPSEETLSTEYEDRIIFFSNNTPAFNLYTPTIINSPQFGVDLSFEGLASGSESVYIDFVSVSVAYQVPAGPSPRRRSTWISIID